GDPRGPAGRDRDADAPDPGRGRLVRLASLLDLVRRDLGRTRGALVTSGFGIAAGTAALVFFLALGLGVRAVLLGEVFPIDQVELEPPKGKDPGLLGLLLGGGAGPAGGPQA